MGYLISIICIQLPIIINIIQTFHRFNNIFLVSQVGHILSRNTIARLRWVYAFTSIPL